MFVTYLVQCKMKIYYVITLHISFLYDLVFDIFDGDFELKKKKNPDTWIL